MYSSRIAKALRDLGHDVVAVKERVELVGTADRELLTAMSAEGRALLTENVADVAPLVRSAGAAGDSHSGLILSSPASMPRSRRTVGAFVTAVDALMRRFPGDGDFADRVEWL
jgi:hypothetical protein